MPPLNQQPARGTTKCGFHGPDGTFIDEVTLRAAVAKAAVDERTIWFDRVSNNFSTEFSDARFGHLVRYWLGSQQSDVRPGRLESPFGNDLEGSAEERNELYADINWLVDESPLSAAAAPLMEWASPNERRELRLLKRVAANITSGLETMLAARPRLKTQALRELVRFLVSMLSVYFFPKGHGRIQSDGRVLRQSALAKITWQAWPRFEHRVRLSLSARIPDGERAGEHQKHSFSTIVLFAPRLAAAAPIPAAGVALHEMAHMARRMVLRFTEKLGEASAARFLAGEPWRLLDLRSFEANYNRIERHLPNLLRAVPIPESAHNLAASFLEETFAYVLGVIVDEAIAPVTYDFSAETLVRHYALHRYDLSKKQLASPAATVAYKRMTGEVEELGRAMRAHLER